MLSWQQWMNKSQASITAARNSLAAGDLAAAASRAYFATFQAVSGALIKQGSQPNATTGNWGHLGTQNQFAVLIRQIRPNKGGSDKHGRNSRIFILFVPLPIMFTRFTDAETAFGRRFKIDGKRC